MNVNKNRGMFHMPIFIGATRWFDVPGLCRVVLSLVLFIGGILPVNLVFADATIAFKKLGSSEVIMPMQVHGAMVRIEPSGLGNGVVLFDGARNIMMHIDHDNKSYTVMDEAALNLMANTVANMQKNVLSQMKGLAPEQRVQMEAMMGQLMGNTVEPKTQITSELRKTTKKKVVADYSCTIIESVKQGVKTADICVVNWSDTTLSEKDFHSLRKFFEFMTNIADKIPGGKKMMEEFSFWESDVNVIPIQVTQYENGKVKSVYQLEDISVASIDASNFSVPKNYKRRNLVPGM